MSLPATGRMISVEDSFMALVKFVEGFCERGPKTSVFDLYSFIVLDDEDGLPLDPAMWPDWLEAVEAVLGHDDSE